MNAVQREVHKLLYGADESEIEKFRALWEKRLSTISDPTVRYNIAEASKKVIEDLTAQHRILCGFGACDRGSTKGEEAIGVLLSTVMLGMQMQIALQGVPCVSCGVLTHGGAMKADICGPCYNRCNHGGTFRGETCKKCGKDVR